MNRRNLCLLAGIAAVFLGRFVYLFATAPVAASRAVEPMHPEAEPLQQDLDLGITIPIPFDGGSVEATPKAAYRIAAKLCGRQRYRGDWTSQIAPYDFCLAWGRLAGDEAKGLIEYSQDMRWYHFQMKRGGPIDAAYAARHSANNHLILTDKDVRQAAARAPVGEIVELTGYLVNLRGKWKDRDVWWNTSLTRDDTGAGSCELIYVKSLRVGDRVYGKPLHFD